MTSTELTARAYDEAHKIPQACAGYLRHAVNNKVSVISGRIQLAASTKDLAGLAIALESCNHLVNEIKKLTEAAI